MKLDLRRAAARTVVAIAGLALAATVTFAQQPGYGPGPVALPYPANVWPQSYSDIEPDPAIRFGTLENGMRFAIMKNATPSGQASLRLRFDAGSMMEDEDQLGLAHFLEHMAFNGSRNVPEGEMIRILERLGLAFGADTNASTGQTQTIYQLDLPRTDDETVDTALMLFREAASELLIEPEAVDRERGIVLSEERSRDGPGYRLYKEELAFVMGDHIAVRRLPIGTPEILSSAPAARIADYWKDYYRPERAVLVAVGDFDIDVMEAKIRQRFADWRPAGPAGDEPPLTLPLRRGPEVKIAVEAGAPQSVSISWISPPDLDPDSSAERQEGLIEGLGFAVLNRRLQRLARGADAPFISAGGGLGDFFRSAQVTSLSATAQTGQWQPALSAAIIEQRRIAEFGVGEAELQREIQEVRTVIQANVQRANTRRTPDLANMITGSAESLNVVTSPAQDLQRFDAMVENVTVEAVNTALRRAFAGSGPLVFMSSPTPIEGGEAAVTAALRAALSAPVQPGESLAVKEWPYTDFGTPGAIASEEEVLDLNTVFIRFENGVQLTVKPTRFREEQILISVKIGSGRLSMPTDRTTADWSLPTAFDDAGLGRLTAEEIEQVMTSRIVGASLSVEDDALSLNGQTRPEDLLIQLQLMAAYATDPGWRPEPFARIRGLAATIHDQQDATAGGVLNRELSPLMRSGDRRWAFPTREEVAASRPEDLRNLLEPQLAGGPIEIIVVGDVNIQAVKDAVAATFGALPPRPAPGWTPPPPPAVSFPAPNEATGPVILTHTGRADQASAVMAWKTDDFFADMRKARALRMLGAIMNLRLIEELRERQGTTYSPQTSFGASSVFPGYGFAAALVETPPENIPGFFEAVETIAASLRDTPVTDDELNRAKAPAIEALQRNFENNGFWLGQLTRAQSDPRRLDAIRSSMIGLQQITPADVQAVAREYLLPGQTWRAVVRAEE